MSALADLISEQHLLPYYDCPAVLRLVGEARRLARVAKDPAMGSPNVELLTAVSEAARDVRCDEEGCWPCLVARRAETAVLALLKVRPGGVAAPKQSGDPCGKCGMFAMVWTGTCRTCGSCGESSGGC